jgi:hypothetical protein
VLAQATGDPRGARLADTDAGEVELELTGGPGSPVT